MDLAGVPHLQRFKYDFKYAMARQHKYYFFIIEYNNNRISVEAKTIYYRCENKVGLDRALAMEESSLEEINLLNSEIESPGPYMTVTVKIKFLFIDKVIFYNSDTSSSFKSMDIRLAEDTEDC